MCSEREWRAEQAQGLSLAALTLLRVKLCTHSLLTHKGKRGAGPELLLGYSSPGCALAPSPLRALAVLSQALLWPQEKAAFWQCKSSILNDTRLIYSLHLPTLLKVSLCLQVFSSGSCVPSLPPLSFWGIPGLFSVVSRVQTALESEPGTRA